MKAALNFLMSVLVGPLLAAGIALPTFADELNFSRVLPQAMQGDAKSQSELAYMYFYGKGVEKDEAEAIKWYQRAAEQKEPSAEHALGILYLNGMGVKADFETAAKWLRRSAEQGLPEAQVDLSVMYINRRIPYDREQCFDLMSDAAEQGFAKAEALMALMFYEGYCLPEMTEAEKVEKGINWARLGVEDGDAQSLFFLGYTLVQNPALQRYDGEGIELLEKGHAQGSLTATSGLAIAYEYGFAIEKNLNQAATYHATLAQTQQASVEWLQANGFDADGTRPLQLSDFNNMNSIQVIQKARDLLKEETVDPEFVAELLKEPASKGDPAALELLLDVLFNLDETPELNARIDSWLVIAVENGVGRAMLLAILGIADMPKPSDEDRAKAIGLLGDVFAQEDASLQRGIENAAAELGLTPSDWTRSLGWYLAKATEGDPSAMFAAASKLYSDTSTQDENLAALCLISKLTPMAEDDIPVATRRVEDAFSDLLQAFTAPSSQLSRQVCAVSETLAGDALMAFATQHFPQGEDVRLIYGTLPFNLLAAPLVLAAVNGDPVAKRQVGLLLSNYGRPELALSWFRAAAEAGDPTGQFLYADSLWQDYFTAADEQKEALLKEQVLWTTLSASQGYAPAYRGLEEVYAGDNYGLKNETLAAQWRQRADDQAVLPQDLFWDQLSAATNDSYPPTLFDPSLGLVSSVWTTKENTGMATGTVKWFNTSKGFGFIAPDDGGKDVFVDISAVERAGLTSLRDDQKIQYKMIEGQNGRPSAGDLVALD